MKPVCLRQRVLVAGLLLALTAHAAALKAQSAPTPALAAADHEKRAQVAYAIQDWPTAIHEFEAAFQIEQKPDYLWGLAQAQRLSGNFSAALNSYKAYRRSDVSADQAAAADNQVAQCQTELAKKHADAAAQQPPAEADSATKPKQAAPKALPDAGPALGQENRPFYLDPVGDVLVITGLAAAGVGTYFLLKGNADVRPSPTLPLFRGIQNLLGRYWFAGETIAIRGVAAGTARRSGCTSSACVPFDDQARLTKLLPGGGLPPLSVAPAP